MPANNKSLHRAKKEKNDLFYTRRCDVENELRHYTGYLKDKWVYMPFDTEKSAFWGYFKDNFKELGLKRITATSWYQDNEDGKGHRLDYDGETQTDIILQGNGSFDSEECTAIMKACDLVCSNPPFSRWRDVIKWLDV